MKNHHRDFAHLRVVLPAEQPADYRGNAMVFGPFPPLTSPSSDHASAVLHLLRSAGYRLTSATGPGLAMAGKQLNFTSAGRFENSSRFLRDDDRIDVSVFYGRAAEFARVSRPQWYRRRLEELRRLKFLTRVIDASQKTCLVLEEGPFQKRDSLCFWAVGKIWSLLRRREFNVAYRTRAANGVVEALTGFRAPKPAPFLAEASAYEAAFDALGANGKVRLTCTRSQQCAQSWAAKVGPEQASPVVDDLDQLVSVFRRHDLRVLPQFKLLWQVPGDVLAPSSGQVNPAVSYACTQDPEYAKFDLPITRYMTHLRASLNKQKEFPLANKADARKFLNWILWDSAAHSPNQRVPLTDELRRFAMAGNRRRGVLDIAQDCSVTPTLGRDANPFALSSSLATLWLNNVDLSSRYDLANSLDRIGFALEVLLRLPADSNPVKVLGASACNWFTGPIGGTGMCLTRIEYLMALIARFELEGAAAAEKPWEDDRIRTWVQHAVFDVFPAVRRMSSVPGKRIEPRHALTLVGLPNSQTGVGSNLKMSLAAFRKIGVSPRILDAADQMRDVELGETAMFSRGLKASVNLFHLNADTVPQAMVSMPAQRRDARNIGFLLWEFGELPECHRLALAMLDEIWVPSTFLRETYSKACDKPVHTVLKGIDLPAAAAVNLAEFGVSGRPFTFLTCFDFHSSVARKNPLSAVKAFQDAFPLNGPEDVRLIVKTTPVQVRHWGDPEQQMDQIFAAAASDPRITVISDHLPFPKLLGLIKACDCLLSPHRAEGFGLMPAYALAMKRPVIATDYSGTRDFCTPETAITLPYKLVEVAANQVLHPMEGAVWANVDHDAFVAALRETQAKPGLARKKALVGAKLIGTCYSMERQAERYAKRLKSLDALY